MNYWEDIINTAMLGTGKKAPGPAVLPAALAEAGKTINDGAETDQEERFLRMAALALNYRQCGVMPLQKEHAVLPVAPVETRSYCNAGATRALNDILSMESTPLLWYWLQCCAGRGLIVPPEYVPALLAIGLQHKSQQAVISRCCGKRGEWLASLNAAWNYSAVAGTDEAWQTGTMEQRKNALKAMRTENPVLALEWLQQTWAQEDAAAKSAFLELLETGLSAADIVFLESLSTEKGKKVKDTALALLKSIPGSAVVAMYAETLRQNMLVRKEKILLGLSSKTSLELRVPLDIPDAVFKSGIDKLSNSKDVTDEVYIISQLVAAVPPAFWEAHLDAAPEKIIPLFNGHPLAENLLPALVKAICRFKDRRWAMLFMQHNPVFYIDVIPLLPPQQQCYYSKKFFADFSEAIIGYAVKMEEEWNLDLTRQIITYVAGRPYHYHRSFFNHHIHLIPVNIDRELEKTAPEEALAKSMWSNTSAYIQSLTALKRLTQQSFNE